MVAIPFDTLKYASTLEAAGVPREQATALSGALEINLKDLATKADLDARLLLLEQRMTIKLGAMLVVALGVFATIVKLL
ncbi:MAG: CCDC90 family protein [Burkholderiaceae bacterium]|jgi:hypothetical protein|nr:CCDC90 family protein [Burkholderiaceae bacterium]